MTGRNKSRALWGTIGLVVVLYYAPSIIDFFHFAPRSPGAASAPIGHGGAAASGADVNLRRLCGIWMGGGTSGEQACSLKFEMRPRPEMPVRYSGYATFTCIPLSRPRVNGGPLAMILSRIPRSAILTGIPADGSVVFHVDKLIGAAQDCPLTEFTATPFGIAQLAADWKNGSCAGGQMVLTRLSQ